MEVFLSFSSTLKYQTLYHHSPACQPLNHQKAWEGKFPSESTSILPSYYCYIESPRTSEGVPQQDQVSLSEKGLINGSRVATWPVQVPPNPKVFHRKRPSLGKPVNLIPAQTQAAESRPSACWHSLCLQLRPPLHAFMKQIRLPSTPRTPAPPFSVFSNPLDIKCDSLMCSIFHFILLGELIRFFFMLSNYLGKMLT